MSKPEYVSSIEPVRTVNNVMRHEYRVLTEGEKTDMRVIKDMGREFHEYLTLEGGAYDPRCIALAKTKIEEAVMWAVKAITE